MIPGPGAPGVAGGRDDRYMYIATVINKIKRNKQINIRNNTK